MRLLVVDDEPMDRAALARLCSAHRAAADVLTADSGAEALYTIRARSPDLVLLDCELTDMTGFDVLRALPAEKRPASIMVATDERHAAEAFKWAAVDYLTKPVAEARFEAALQRVRILAPNAMAADAAIGGRPQEQTLGLGNRLIGERASRLYFLSPEVIDYIEANGNYITIYAGQDKYINRDSLKRLAPLLERCGFVRISRWILVNLRRVSFAERDGRGVLAFVLASGARVQSSSGFRLGVGAELRVERRRRARRPIGIT
jgi:two-component system LytT family response regulator